MLRLEVHILLDASFIGGARGGILTVFVAHVLDTEKLEVNRTIILKYLSWHHSFTIVKGI